ncbi:hypothetical protein PMZ80_002606 [Knufia obscura]|uniref:Uncharacterized protein n=2 Tax=Knufia TaxID=430999 RepID=A0AAN8F4X5_9EURO|nr:hypothetical protein PMZ80_002606 [Knufia obscura]KAK5951386.1 hypothetical protein OHC33_007442 [Knufia fluminis]
MFDYSKCNHIKYSFPGVSIHMCATTFPETPECQPWHHGWPGLHKTHWPCGKEPPFHHPGQPDKPFKFGDGWRSNWGWHPGQEDVYWKDATYELDLDESDNSSE